MSLAIPVSGPIVVVHGGAGAGVVKPELAPVLRQGLARAVEAGRGALLTADGDIEHDAAVMDGRRRRAGAIAAVRGQPNPIRVARALLEEGRHGMLAGEGATRFAEEAGFPPV